MLFNRVFLYGFSLGFSQNFVRILKFPLVKMFCMLFTQMKNYYFLLELPVGFSLGQNSLFLHEKTVNLITRVTRFVFYRITVIL